MTDDIAVLGLSIDSSQAVTAAAALDKLTVAAKTTAPAVSALEQAAAGASTSGFRAMTTAAAPATAALATMEDALTAAVGDMNVFATAQRNGTTLMGAHSESIRGQRMVLRGLAADLALFGPQVGQTAGMLGMLYVDQLHVMGGWQGLKTSIGALMTPTNLFLGGLAAIAAGSYLAYSSIKATEMQFGALSDRTNTAIQSLHAFESVADMKGIATPDFLTSMEKFGDLSAQARDNMGSLAETFRANGVASGTLTDNLFHAADLIKNAASEAARYQIIQQLGLPATREWVTYLSQGGDALRQATDEAAKFGGAADEQLIARGRMFDEEWNKTWRNFGTNSKSAFVETIAWFDSLSDSATRALMKLGANVPTNLLKSAMAAGGQGLTGSQATSIYNAVGTGAGVAAGSGSSPNKTTIDPAVVKNEIALIQQRIGALGQLASVEQQVTQKQNELRLARMQPGSLITDADTSRIIAYTAASALGTLAIRTQVAAAKLGIETAGMGVGETAAYTAVQEKVNEAILKGNPLKQAQIDLLKKEAEALRQVTQDAAEGGAENALDFARAQLARTTLEQQVATQMKTTYGSDNYQSYMDSALATQIRFNDALTQTKTVGENALTGFVQDLRDSKTAADALGNVMIKLENQLINIASNKIMSSLIGSGGDMLSGLFGGAASAGGSKGIVSGVNHTGYGPSDSMPTRYVHPAYFDDAPRFHTGIGPGERPAIIKDNESVLTPGQMRALAPAGTGGGGPVTVNIMNAPAGTTATATTSTDSTGGKRIDVLLSRMVDDTGAAAIDSGQSAINQSIERRYGLTPKL